MSLIERDYMKETYEDRKKARIERIEKEVTPKAFGVTSFSIRSIRAFFLSSYVSFI